MTGNNVNTKSIIYYLVAAYIGYMAFGILNNRIHGDDTMSWPVAIIFTVVLASGAIGVICYATRLMEKTKSQAQENTECEEKKDSDEEY